MSGCRARLPPEWPPLDSLNATVLINDTDVSVWADTARLFDTRVSELSVEVWMDDAAQLWLAVDGDLAGPAADGLAVINSSPCATVSAMSLPSGD